MLENAGEESCDRSEQLAQKSCGLQHFKLCLFMDEGDEETDL